VPSADGMATSLFDIPPSANYLQIDPRNRVAGIADLRYLWGNLDATAV